MMAFVLQSGRWFSNHLSPGPCEPKTCGQGKIGDPAVDGQRAKISPHDPEVSGSNPTSATNHLNRWFLIDMRADQMPVVGKGIRIENPKWQEFLYKESNANS